MNAETRIRKRIPKSCKRCHRRKQRCVGYPTCSGCEAAKQPCLRSESAPSWHHAMSKGALVHRIEVLEAQLSAALEQIPSDAAVLEQPTGASHRNDDSQSGIAPLMELGHDGSENQAYLGSSSGLSIAEDLGSLVQNAVWVRSIPINGSDQSDSVSIDVGSGGQGVTIPDEAVGLRLLNAYFRDMHTRLPFLDRAELLDLHAMVQRNPRSSPDNQSGRFKIFMVYAIGAAILQMTETYDATPPSAFLATALQLEPTAKESQHARIEAIMLLVLYHLRTSSASKVWYLIGLAMRICIDLGLHRGSQYQKMNPHRGQMRRRLFWSVYLVERYISWSLGRPFSIAEEEFDADVPADVEDSCTDDPMEQTQHSPQYQVLGGSRRFIALTRLQRIMSQIHTRIYRTDKTTTALIPETVPLMAALEEFERSFPALTPEEADFVHMHWNNAIRMLIQRFIGILPRGDVLIAKCLPLRRDSAGYSFLLVNSLYMAGLTICLCLFRAPQLWTVVVSNDLRACSSALFVMAERNASLKKYRDGLETIINRAMEFVQEAGSTDTESGVHQFATAQPTDPPREEAGLQTGMPTGENSMPTGFIDFQCPFPPAGGLAAGQDIYG
ncbi:hypothetical protein BO71DRAFT_475767 [Aspergillus ellipticus CBS 707.79]|uniref:Zn(2)-C6 fungal-type domain-containing protein n=1 Tax=Aspergillus ellipticus CBS 707.79 TaxID=1448320 RepID=A0A319DB15_9EURO|nr:hypothetical protein BO71DRAFT_475767 [Aspergillus ellipticus CBS 707.79]